MILTKSYIRVYQFPILVTDTLKFEYNFLILFRRGFPPTGTFMRRIYDSIIVQKLNYSLKIPSFPRILIISRFEELIGTRLKFDSNKKFRFHTSRFLNSLEICKWGLVYNCWGSIFWQLPPFIARHRRGLVHFSLFTYVIHS